MNVMRVVVDPVERNHPDIAEEVAALDTRFQASTEIKAFLLTFISKPADGLEQLVGLEDDDFLGQAWLINFRLPAGEWKSYVYKAIFKRPVLPGIAGSDSLMNNYLHVDRTFTIQVPGPDNCTKPFSINGSFFCQQNQFTSVCAHATLSMVINNMDLQGLPLITPEYVNRAIGIDHRAVMFGEGGNCQGLSIQELLSVLNSLNLKFEWLDCKLYPNDDYEQFVYKYIESRCPVVLIFSTAFSAYGLAQHVVPVLGHTLNSDMWGPEADAYDPYGRLGYRPSSFWIDHFVIHDDNFGMYYCLPVGRLKRTTLPKYDPTFRVFDAIAIVPQQIMTPAWQAEWASVVVTKDMLSQRAKQAQAVDVWTNRLIASRDEMVVRTFLVDKAAYEKSLEEDDFEHNRFSDPDKAQLLQGLPDTFWLSEITLADLYCANKTKIVDFFYRSDSPRELDQKAPFDRWIQVRFPYALSRYVQGGAPEIIPLSVKSHYPLFRFRAKDAMEW
jgi:hypothetical protein